MNNPRHFQTANDMRPLRTAGKIFNGRPSFYPRTWRNVLLYIGMAITLLWAAMEASR